MPRLPIFVALAAQSKNGCCRVKFPRKRAPPLAGAGFWGRHEAASREQGHELQRARQAAQRAAAQSKLHPLLQQAAKSPPLTPPNGPPPTGFGRGSGSGSGGRPKPR